MPLDLYRIQSATQRAKDYTADTIRKVKNYLIDDSSHERRIAEHLCRWCYYRMTGAMAGQAFTEYICALCGEEHSHPNTAVPTLCTPCAAETGLCIHCCGDVEGRQVLVAPKPREMREKR